MGNYAAAINAHDDPKDPAYGPAFGIDYAISSARVPGATDIAFRRAMTVEQIEEVIQRMVSEGILTIGEVPRWLNSHFDEWEAIAQQYAAK